MDFETTVLNLPAQILKEFEQAVQTGHWGSGLPLTDEQRNICKQALTLRYAPENTTIKGDVTIY